MDNLLRNGSKLVSGAFRTKENIWDKALCKKKVNG